MHTRFARTAARLLALLALLALAGWAAPPRVQAQGTNLLDNPGFESGGAGWSLCGVAEVVDNRTAGVDAFMVYNGRRAVRLTRGDDGCGSPVFDPDAAAHQNVSIPAGAPAVTISFWYSRVGDPVWPLTVSLGDFGFVDQVYTENLAGWHLFRAELPADLLERVRGETVTLEIASGYNTTGNPLPQTSEPGFYLDDVRVVAGLERTAEAPLPEALRGNTTQPIVYLDGQLGGIARVNPDGSGAQLLYGGRAGAPLGPVWSSRGDRIAVLDEWLTPDNTTDFSVNPARISIVSTFSPGGGGLREVYRTSGLPGRRPPVPSPGDPEQPALDVVVASVDWSPDDSTLALSICSSNRAQTGSTSDPICWVELIDSASGASKGKFEPGFHPNWGANNRVLYEESDSYGDKPDGIYELDASAQPPSEQLLVPGTGLQFKPSFYTDSWPTWSPDGAMFATVRDVDGFHYNEDGSYVAHKAIMLFGRGELVGRMLLLVDHGSSPSNLTWSPDGAYLLYSLFQGNSVDVWWLEARSGATGRVTSNGQSIAADWRPRCPTPDCSDGSRLFLPMLRR